MDFIIDFFIEAYSNTSFTMMLLELIAFVFGIVSVIYAKKENCTQMYTLLWMVGEISH